MLAKVLVVGSLVSAVAAMVYGAAVSSQPVIDVGGVVAWSLAAVVALPLTVGTILWPFLNAAQRVELLQSLTSSDGRGPAWGVVLGRVFLVSLILSGETFGAAALIAASGCHTLLLRWAKGYLAK